MRLKFTEGQRVKFYKRGNPVHGRVDSSYVDRREDEFFLRVAVRLDDGSVKGIAYSRLFAVNDKEGK